ncbi:MAG TPA: divergent polysaccharide deacetylase family protein [Clostridia bacterium]|nr:divergent polysaccharide deacetylase family protein [Clostridia bacterium]
MKRFKVFILGRKSIFTAVSVLIIIIFIACTLFIYSNRPANSFTDPQSGIIVIDPGHGGVDGGANRDGILEKDINLAIAKKLKLRLEQKAYKVIMTREKDISLDDRNESSSSRHQRDLNARLDVINNSNAQMFLSIHVNCNLSKPATDGSIVFFGEKFPQSRQLAYLVQRSFNSMVVDGVKRTVHDPQTSNYFLLKHSRIPGVIAETAFISNAEERRRLTEAPFQEQLAEALSYAIERYLTGNYEDAGSISKIDGGKLAIIIDDFGSGRDGVKEMMAIDRHLTFAVMPFLDYSHSDAEKAHEKGFEVIVHLPLEAYHGRMSWLGPEPILSGMNADRVRDIAQRSFDDIPYAVGANIHMGSKASGSEDIAHSILGVVKERDMYFVDSKTAYHPVCSKVSSEMGVVCFERDVFLDGKQPKSFVKKRLAEAGEIALKKGRAVAIGHVGIEGGKVTAAAISEMLPEFDEKGIQLVFVSELDTPH